MGHSAAPVYRVFVSSPGDVAEERALAERVIANLARQWADVLTIEAFLWEHEPIHAAAGFQTQIDRICRPSDCDAVVCVLWSRFGTRLPLPDPAKPDRVYRSGTEYELTDALEAFEHSGTTPVLLVYKKTAGQLIALDDPRFFERREQRDTLEAFLREWSEDERGSPLHAVHRFAAAGEFESLLEQHVARLIATRAEALGQTRQRGRAWRDAPFRGLAVFEPAHAPIFFGRTAAISAALAALRAREARAAGFLAIVGASGSGKSSFVRAGLIPLLTTAGVFPGVDIWRRAIVVPGEGRTELFESLAAALLAPEALPELGGGGQAARELADAVRANPVVLATNIAGALRQIGALRQRELGLTAPPAVRLAIVVDQLEQLFALDGIAGEQRQMFVRCLQAAVESRLAVVLATLRSDFFQRCDEVPELVELMRGDGQYQLEAPNRAELLRVISRPAALAGLAFDEATDDVPSLDLRLRDAAAEQPHSLPLLEFALEQLYERRTADGRLTHEAYEALGELKGAVATHAEDAFRRWTAAQTLAGGSAETAAAAAFAALFRRLVVVSAGDGSAASKRAGEAEIPPGAASSLAEALLEARLLTVDRDAAGQRVFAVAHEAVLREWPRARDWLSANLETLRAMARVAADRAVWTQANRDAGLLLPEGPRLAAAQDLLRRSRQELDAESIAYIEASAGRATAALWWRRSRWVAAALLVAGIAFGLYAARNARQIEEQRRVAVAYRLAAWAELTRGDQAGLSALLAAESLLREPTVDGDRALRRSLQLMPQLVYEGEIIEVATTSPPPGRSIVEASASGLRVVDTRTGAASPWVLSGLRDELTPSMTHVTADGRRLVNLTNSGSRLNRLRVVDLATQLVTITEVQGSFSRSALSPDGSRLIAVERARVVSWDLSASPAPAAEGSWPADDLPRLLVFSPDSRRIAMTSNYGVHVFDATLAAEPVTLKSDGSTRDIAFSPPDGGRIAVTERDTVCLHGTGDTWCIPQDQETMAMAFSPDGSQLALAGETGVLRVMDVNKRGQTARFAHDGGIGGSATVEWNASGTAVATTTLNKVVHVWSVEHLREVARMTDEARLLWFDGAGTVATISNSSRLRRWTFGAGLAEQRLMTHPSEVHDVIFTPDAKSVITGSGNWADDSSSARDHTVRIWPVDGAGPPVEIPHQWPVGVVRLLGDGRHLLAASWFGISITDIAQQRSVAELDCRLNVDDLDNVHVAFAISRNGRVIACPDDAKAVRLFSLPDGKPVGPPLDGEARIGGLALSDDGRYLARALDGAIEVRDLTGARQPVRIPVEEEVGLQFLSGAPRLAVLSATSVRIVDVERGGWAPLRIDAPSTKLPLLAADGKRIVLLHEAAASVHDLESGREIARIPHPSQVDRAVLSSDGRRLATIAGGVARVWDLAKTEEIMRLTIADAAASDRHLAISPDGRFIATASSYDVRLWPVSPEDLRAQTCNLVRGNLTAAEWATYVGRGDACSATCPAFPACDAATSDRDTARVPRLLR